MKTQTKHFFKIAIALLLTLIVFNCSSSDDSDSPTQIDSPTPIKDVNDISIVFSMVDTPTTPEDPGSSGVKFSMIGDKVYYMNSSFDSPPINLFMLEYDISDNVFTNKLPSTEFCGCGFSNNIVSDGVSLFYITNGAVKYSPSIDMWTDLNYPLEFRDNNGEAGIAYLNNKIYFFGGRTATRTFKYYEISTDTWQFAPDGPYDSGTSEMVAVVDTLYSLGGDFNSSNKLKFSSYNETDDGWFRLEDLPFELTTSSRNILAVTYLNRYIFVLNSDDIYI